MNAAFDRVSRRASIRIMDSKISYVPIVSLIFSAFNFSPPFWFFNMHLIKFGDSQFDCLAISREYPVVSRYYVDFSKLIHGK